MGPEGGGAIRVPNGRALSRHRVLQTGSHVAMRHTSGESDHSSSGGSQVQSGSGAPAQEETPAPRPAIRPLAAWLAGKPRVEPIIDPANPNLIVDKDR
ncbi:MAG: hypothetical protein HQL63_12025 [Magnetococcales bacterium]|nr:hypothetical protein [Magnetococcales bacterium]